MSSDKSINWTIGYFVLSFNDIKLNFAVKIVKKKKFQAFKILTNFICISK